MFAVLGWLASFIPGLETGVLTYLNKKADTALEGYKAGTGADTERLRAVLSAHLENNRLKLVQNGWWGAKAIILLAGIPAAAHMGGIFLDSLPFPVLDGFGLAAHVVGSWRIPRLPAPYDGYEWSIVQSFFLVLPAMPVASAAAAWLSRR